MNAGVRFQRAVGSFKAAVLDLFDQRRPLGRLALTQVMMIAGDTLVTVSLAGSLFFSISPNAARGKVVLYLLLTMAPFAVVAPALAPILDRGTGSRRTMAVLSGIGRALLCILMASSVHSLLLFPEAFGVLVFSKLYMITKSSLVPTVVEGRLELAVANSRLAVAGAVAGFVAAGPGAIFILVHFLGSVWLLRVDAMVYFAASAVALRLPKARVSPASPASPLYGTNGPPGPPGSAASGPPGSVPPVGAGDQYARAGQSPPRRLGPWNLPGRSRPAVPFRHLVPADTLLASMAMSVLRGSLGFLTFLLAFSLRRHHAATWWYGLVIVGSGIGAILGSLTVPYLRRIFTEVQILMLALSAVVVAGAASGLAGSRLAQVGLATVVGFTAAIGKPSFDAIVQKSVASAAQGRAFGRFETRFQMAWVVGGLVPVLASLPVAAGDVVIASVAMVTGASYVTARRALMDHNAQRGGDSPPFGP